MPESLIDAPAPAEAMPTLAPADGKRRPPEVPEKFWDDAKGEIRVDALLKSYRELERRSSRLVAAPDDDNDAEGRARLQRLLGWPETPDEYQVEQRHPLTAPDADVNKRLHEAGFTKRQVQLVYDLAAERLLPLIAEAAAEFEADRERDRLIEHFGGEERFRQSASQLAAWGKANLPEAVYTALSATFDGVLAIERMMAKGEPALMREGNAETAPSEQELRSMVRDPRYWRNREPAFVARVQEGFRRLFPNG